MTMTNVRKSFQFIGIVAIGIIGVIIGALIFTNVFRALGIMDTFAGKILLTWLAMLVGFATLPTLLLRKKYAITVSDMGFGTIKKSESLICILAISSAILYIIFGRKIIGYDLFFIAILQNIGVAVFEEYFSKAVLFYSMKKITENKVVIVLLCSCIFAFVMHSSDDIMINLAYRFPMALILGTIYLKTGKLYLPITLHFINNLLSTSLLN